ncbi:MAG: ABC transporter ATP-binding protein [Thermomicrobiales bacterium]|nr:ABC transporter ATP-binding protein [Thermomicrobiales bacterium]MCO5222742.1 ABC transporter ATP-binding protein [Thermomicrobiales bacterium]
MTDGTATTQERAMVQPIVSMREIDKRFGPVRANDKVSLTLYPGEIHAVLGENGAGKTTLMNILSGMYQPDGGTIELDGKPITIGSPSEALAHGIGTVYQHFTLVPNLSVIENVVLGTKTGFVLNLSKGEQRLKEVLTEFELNTDPNVEVRHLSIGQRQRVEIIKVLMRGTRVLLLDEPTSVLTPTEVEGLFRILRRLREEGVSVVIITHKLEEALDVSDRVTILRGGKNVGELGPDDIASAGRAGARQRIVETMFGGMPAAAETFQQHVATGKTLLELSGVSAIGDRGEIAIRELSIQLRAGEIYGIAGVDGNGQKELGEIIAGQRKTTTGRLALDGTDYTNAGVATLSRAGVGYITDDRLGEGVVPGMSVAQNAALKTINRSPFSKGFWLDRKAIEANANTLIEQFSVRTPSAQTKITLLSGGNIQKLMLARELAMDPRVIVCNKPTYGLDLKTAQFVLQTLRQEADSGKAVLLISSELDEILEISDRIGVIYNGEIVETFERAQVDIETVGRLMLSGRAAVAGSAA